MSEHGEIEIKLGYDVEEVIAGFNRLAELFRQGHDAIGLSQRLADLEEQQRQQRWATDPMGLMDWLDPDQWRWFLVNRIVDVQDVLGAIAEWIEPD